MNKIKMFITAIVLFVCIANAYAQDWPQFLGPNRNSISDQKGILRTWHATGPEVLSDRRHLASGYGGPVVKRTLVRLDPGSQNTFLVGNAVPVWSKKLGPVLCISVCYANK